MAPSDTSSSMMLLAKLLPVVKPSSWILFSRCGTLTGVDAPRRAPRICKWRQLWDGQSAQLETPLNKSSAPHSTAQRRNLRALLDADQQYMLHQEAYCPEQNVL